MYQYLLGKVSTLAASPVRKIKSFSYQYLLGKVSTKKPLLRGHTWKGVNIY